MIGIPTKETIWAQHVTESGRVYYVTSTALRDVYYMYEVVDGKATKLGKASTPPELEKKFIKEG